MVVATRSCVVVISLIGVLREGVCGFNWKSAHYVSPAWVLGLEVWFHAPAQYACEKSHKFPKLVVILTPNRAISLHKASVPRIDLNNAEDIRVTPQTQLALGAFHILDHPAQSGDVDDNDRSAGSLDEAHGLQVIKLAGDRLAIATDTSGNLGMGRRRSNVGAIAVTMLSASKSQQLGMDSVFHTQCAELDHPCRELANEVGQPDQRCRRH
jgi:hypothetical protein